MEHFEDQVFKPCTARNLNRVVAIGAKETVEGITVALTAFEVYENDNGILRYLISFDPGGVRSFSALPKPHIEVVDESGNSLPANPFEGGASERNANGLVQVAGLPASGNLRVQILRIFSTKFITDVEGPTWDGPWVFDFGL